MVQQADSILTAETALEAAEQQQVLKQHGSQLTPKQVLSWLPKNATPAQQCQFTTVLSRIILF